MSEEVRGIIIGPTYTWGRFYNDRGGWESPDFYGDSDTEVIAAAKAWFNENRWSSDGTDLYPDGLELRIW